MPRIRTITTCVTSYYFIMGRINSNIIIYSFCFISGHKFVYIEIKREQIEEYAFLTRNNIENFVALFYQTKELKACV